MITSKEIAHRYCQMSTHGYPEHRCNVLLAVKEAFAVQGERDAKIVRDWGKANPPSRQRQGEQIDWDACADAILERSLANDRMCNCGQSGCPDCCPPLDSEDT